MQEQTSKVAAENQTAHVFYFGQSDSSTTPPPMPSASSQDIFHFGAPANAQQVFQFGLQRDPSPPPLPSASSQDIFHFGVHSDTSAQADAPPVFHFGLQPSDLSGSGGHSQAAQQSPPPPSFVPWTPSPISAQASPATVSFMSGPSSKSGRKERARAGKRRQAAPIVANEIREGGGAQTVGSPEDTSSAQVQAGWNAGSTLAQPAVAMGLLEKECRLGEAERHAREQRFAEAAEACITLIDGPDRALAMLRGVCESWSKHDRDQALSRESEVRSITSQLMAAKDASDSLRKLKEVKDRELQAERFRREEAESQLALLQRRSRLLDETQRENSRMKQEIRELRVEARRRPQIEKEDVVKCMADVECAPLLQCSSAERVGMKKKILLKWHPDKQPSQHHASFATQVMQELQNRAEWSW